MWISRETCGSLLDPRALRRLPTPWGDQAVSLIQNFFTCVLDAIRRHDDGRAQALLQTLREPNELHFGLSRGRARGRALGPESAHDVWTALGKSEAAQSGLLEDLEDTVLLVPGIGPDIVSDIAANIIRRPLIAYTQEQCSYHGIPLTADVDSGPLWDPAEKEWSSGFVSLPTTPSGKLLLVPKSIVRRRLDYDADEYYRHYILEHLKDEELNARTALVRLLKDGRERVYKKDLIKKYGQGKAVIVKKTLENPSLLEDYPQDKWRNVAPPLDHEDIAELEETETPNFQELLDKVKRLRTGREDANAYLRAVEELLTAALYPSLSNPHRELPIHNGRKRIDITYTNIAEEGFFGWLGKHYPSGHIFVECKNYTEDPRNPELDQLAGRFSPRRGKVGLLVCRRIDDKRLMLRRSRDAANDDRGFIIALDDDDLEVLIEKRVAGESPLAFELLKSRFDAIVM